jgi:nicotinamide-nucleotide amidase
MKTGSPLVRQVGSGLRARGLTVAVAESCTAGLLGYRLTSVPGSSEWFRGGVIAYANDVKNSVLGVSRATLAAHGAVSKQVAAQMAAGARRVLAADIGMGITGVAGPGGGTARKPVGLVWIGLAAGNGISTRRHLFGGGRASVRALAVLAALGMLKRHMGREKQYD